MKVMLLPRRRGIWRSVDTTIHSLQGRLATLLQIPVALLSCFVVKFISWVSATVGHTRLKKKLAWEASFGVVLTVTFEILVETKI